ncbi:phosphate ABC transporter substrate-binding protein PstS [Hoyosella rhizosphaerae]|uniref:Phosphate-binding protein n=2 Tax=Hoyosella rhizosphaerae TaxID=1755582 RepID=A0A916UHZ4_9ACTN|nr:phosphate ABC transporter substrate-binding protein PstS [Hoyosella rhizosphaerae]MBN4928232.1 phosphate ABC transporter substrate-binding protein PstS [Hoyosella rhizosphaerae]GGC73412.1 phosphate-binding protein PstS [Hoyosella rhizosphaerae]
MKPNRGALFASLATIGALMMTGCITEEVGPGNIDTLASCEGKPNLSATGSTAQANAMAAFNVRYGESCPGKNIAYTSSGSGDGRVQFASGFTDFGGTDSPIVGDQLKQAQERCGGDVWNLPLVFGPVGIGYNLDGFDGIVMDAETIAKVFNGEIRRWNDSTIAAQNPDMNLPDQGISVIHRSDSSGTTDNFQLYLETAANGAWTTGAGSDFTGGIGSGFRGNEGVSQAVAAARGSVSYIEMAYVEQNGLQSVKIDSGSGPVALSVDNATNAIAQAEFASTGDGDLTLDLGSVYGASGADEYPLVLATYEIVCGQGYDPDTSAAVKSFLTVAANEGQVGIERMGYAPLPSSFQARLMDSIEAIQ